MSEDDDFVAVFGASAAAGRHQCGEIEAGARGSHRTEPTEPKSQSATYVTLDLCNRLSIEAPLR